MGRNNGSREGWTCLPDVYLGWGEVVAVEAQGLVHQEEQDDESWTDGDLHPSCLSQPLSGKYLKKLTFHLSEWPRMKIDLVVFEG
jgi:hypothetical protein